MGTNKISSFSHIPFNEDSYLIERVEIIAQENQQYDLPIQSQHVKSWEIVTLVLITSKSWTNWKNNYFSWTH